MERETIHKSQDVPSGFETYFVERGYDYVEYLGDFMTYKVYRARYYDENALVEFPAILAKDHKFRRCRSGYEKHIVLDYLKKGKDNYTMWHLLAIRIGLFVDMVLCYMMALLFPHPEYSILKRIKTFSSEDWKEY